MSHTQIGINDLPSQRPDLMSQWDYEKNENIEPESIAVRSNKKVWWKCELGHSWNESPDRRSRGQNCPYCSGKRVLAGFNDLMSQAPQLAIDWDYEKNLEFGPDEITTGSNKKVHWKCHICDYEWITSPNSRKNGTRKCPQCAEEVRVRNFRKNFVKSGNNDLLSQAPKIVQEWDYQKNQDIMPEAFTINSKEKVWWKCRTCGNEWLAQIKNRVLRGSGCPKCMKHQKTSFPEQAIFYYTCTVFEDAENSYTGLSDSSNMELDIYIPKLKVGIEYDGIAWHTNENSQKRDHKKYVLCKNLGIKLIRVSEFDRTDIKDCDEIIVRENSTDAGLNDAINMLLNLLCVSDVSVDVQRDRVEIMTQYITHIGSRSIAVQYPNEAMFWDADKNKGLTADMVSATSNVSYWWKCKLNHSYKASPTNRLGTGHGCPYCSGRRVLKGFNDFETQHPNLVKEWDYTRNGALHPYDLSSGSTKQVFWMCEKGHSYKASPNNKVYNKTKCPYCSNIKVLSGFNDLKTIYPQLLKKWDYKLNNMLPEEILYNSHRNAIWKCEEGHTWTRTISAQLKYDGCPICKGQVLLVGFNDLVTTFPDIARDWDYDKNIGKPEDYTRLSRKNVFWKCAECGHEWNAKIFNRITRNTGCPKCGYSRKMHETRKKNLQKNGATLGAMYPDLASEWDYQKNTFKPTDISPGANKKAWWICSLGHSYQAWVTDRTGKQRTSCPYCSGKRSLEGFNDLKTLFPTIAAEWDYKKNDGKRPEEFSAQNSKKVWWICEKGHSYESTIGSRTAKRHQNGCPYCANKKVLKGYNDLQTCYPEIAREWDYALNGDLSPSDVVFGSAKKVWWKCSKCDFSWQNGIVYRTSMGNGCPECNRRRLSKPVRCIETGECFQTIKEASQKTGISKDSITKNLTGKNKSAGGYHWEHIKIDINENN